MVRFAKERDGLILDSIDVNFFVNDEKRGGISFSLNVSPQEAFTILSLPCFVGMISSLIPIYDDQKEEDSFKLEDFRNALSEVSPE